MVGEHGKLQFEHGAEADFDLVVGCNAAWSKIRLVLSDVRPFCSGIGGYELVINKAGEMYSDVARLIGRGVLVK